MRYFTLPNRSLSWFAAFYEVLHVDNFARKIGMIGDFHGPKAQLRSLLAVGTGKRQQFTAALVVIDRFHLVEAVDIVDRLAGDPEPGFGRVKITVIVRDLLVIFTVPENRFAANAEVGNGDEMTSFIEDIDKPVVALRMGDGLEVVSEKSFYNIFSSYLATQQCMPNSIPTGLSSTSKNDRDVSLPASSKVHALR